MKATITKIPYGRQWIGDEEIRAVRSVLKSSFLTQGPKVQEFESALAKKFGASYAVAVANGTAALHLAAISLDLKEGDEVITSPNSFLATANAILYAGATPVFADIENDTQSIDPEKIKNKITSRTRAIFFTDFAGHPADLKAINDIAKKNKLKIVEDAAHSIGSTYFNSKIGSCRFSDMSVFSFHPVKHITTGEGGAITTNNKDLYEKLCMLRTHGVTRDFAKFQDQNQGAWYYEMQDLGFNYRLTDIQAVLGLQQLGKLDQFIAKRRKIAKEYNKAFASNPEIRFPEEKKGSTHVYHLYVIRLQEHLVKKRRAIFEELQNRGIGVQVHYIPITSQPYYQKLGYKKNDYPNAQKYYESAISLPIFPKMTDKEIKFVIKTVKDVLFSFLEG